MITGKDYRLHKAGVISRVDLAYKYNCSLDTVRRYLKAHDSPNQHLHRQDRQDLAEELRDSIPNDPVYGLKPTLVRYGLKSLNQALQLLKVTSLNDLRHGKGMTQALQAVNYHVENSVLVPRGAGNRDRQHLHIRLTPEEIEEFKTAPQAFIKNKKQGRPQ